MHLRFWNITLLLIPIELGTNSHDSWERVIIANVFEFVSYYVSSIKILVDYFQ